MRYSNSRWSWIIVLVGSLWSVSLAQKKPDIREFEPGKSIERELAGGDVHAYSINVTAGKFLGVIVDQRGIDVILALFAPDGKQLTEVDSPNGTQGPEPISVVAKASGLYRLEVRVPDKKAAAGRYEAKIEALRDATPEDSKAENLKTLAATLAATHTEEDRAALLMKEKELVTRDLLQALKGLGKSFERRDKYPAALSAHLSAQRVAEQIGDHAEIAISLRRSGENYFALGNNAQASAYFFKSLAAFEALGDRAAAAGTLNFLGIVNHQLGNLAEAIEFYQKSLALWREVGNQASIATAIRNIGNIHVLQGNYTAALSHYQQSLAMTEALKDENGLASTLNNMAVVYENQGNLTQSLESYRKSFALREKLGNKRGMANARNNLGGIYQMMGDYQQALEYFQQSLTIRHAIEDKFGVASTLQNIGFNYKAMGDGALALKYFQQSLTLAEEMGNKILIIALRNQLGDLADKAGDYPKAAEHYEKCLSLSEAAGSKIETAKSLNGLAHVHFSEGRHKLAAEFAERAATLAREIGTRHQLIAALTTAGRTYHALNQPVESRQAFAEAITVTESLRSSVAGQEARATLFATAQQPYELYLDVLMQQHKEHPSAGHDVLALQVNEAGRARSLLEALSEARADIRQGVDPVLLQRERSLQQQLNARAERQTRLLSGKHTAEQAAALKKEIYTLTTEYRDVQAQIRQRSPRYAALTQPQPLTVRELQTDVLDADTLLLEYALGEDKSYLWAMTPTSVTSFELPKRAEIEAAVRRAVTLLSDGKQWATSNRIQAEYAEVAGRLSQILLVPVAAQLNGKRLLIVGDSALQYLPFGALPSPKSKVQGPKSRNGRQITGYGQPLIIEHEIVSLPSASTLAILRRETANRARPTKNIAVLADPVFEREDERVSVAATGSQTVSKAGASSASKDTNSELTNSRYLLERAFGPGLQAATAEGGASRVILRIPRLAFTRREADAILAIAPAGEGMKALDFRASRETATSAELAQYRIVHFATHGLLNSEHPELSGIVLSLVNEAGQPVDGFLRLHEIYNLQLSADMVVLSACQTGLGKEIRGEGLVGLTRGFMHAGALRVVASLWKVDDAATAELMKRFYRGMLKDNLRPAAALRAAKVEMWKQKRWNAPFYWAAFELQGEWK